MQNEAEKLRIERHSADDSVSTAWPAGGPAVARPYSTMRARKGTRHSRGGGGLRAQGQHCQIPQPGPDTVVIKHGSFEFGIFLDP